MAKMLNIARTTYTGYENGNFAPSFEKVLQIKEVLNYKRDDIFFIHDDSETNKVRANEND